MREILLVEDNTDDRDLFAAALQASGIAARLTWVTNAADAVMRLNRHGEFAGQSLPTLVVLDLGLPGLDGKALLQVIRTAYGLETLPVVVLTGSQRAADRVACEQWGIRDYLTKPVAYAEHVRLITALRQWLPEGEPASVQAAHIANPRAGDPTPPTQIPIAAARTLSPAHQHVSRVHRSDVLPGIPGSSTASTFRLMVVEDNPDDYDLLTNALRSGGISCLVSWHRDGRSALDTLRRDRSALPDLIITDLMMDGMSGHELLYHLRLEERLRQIPIVILTGSLATTDRDLAATADHYFIKPRTRLEWRVITALVWRYVMWHVRRVTDAPASGPQPHESHPLILHVASHEKDRELFQTAFQRSGIAARLEQTMAEEVIDDSKCQVTPQVIVVDLASGRSGLEFLALVRASATLQQVPIIIFCATPIFREMQTYRDLYVIDYVVKPITPRHMSEFIGALRQWFSSRLAQMQSRY